MNNLLMSNRIGSYTILADTIIVYCNPLELSKQSINNVFHSLFPAMYQLFPSLPFCDGYDGEPFLF